MNAPAPQLGSSELNLRLLKLIGLAQDAEPERRRELIHEITELFFEKADTLTAKEHKIFCLIMAKLAQGISPADRCALAAQLETIPGIPPEIIFEVGPSEGALIQLLREGRTADFINGFARAVALDVGRVEKALLDSSGEALVAICRDAGFARVTYSSIVVLCDPLGLRAAKETYRLLSLFAQDAGNVVPLRGSRFAA